MALSLAANQNNPEVVVNTLVKSHLQKDCAGGSNVTLNDPDEARYSQIECTGVITANIDLIVPAEAKVYIIRNNTTATGGETLTVKVTGTTGVAVTNGSAFHLACDGTSVYRVV